MRCCEAALCYSGPVEKLCWGAWGEALEGEVWEFLGSPMPRSLTPCMQRQERSEEHVSDDGHCGEKRDVCRETEAAPGVSTSSRRPFCSHLWSVRTN